MKMNILKKIIFIGFFFYLPTQSNAWGTLGHRIVGQIADSYLTSTAKKQIAKILGNESIAMATNWADFIKSDSTLSYLSPWHYADLPGGLSHTQVLNFFKKDTLTDAYTKLNFLIKELKNKRLAKEKKQMYLRLLIHIVGDIHQPLHVGRPSDRGGNDIKVTWFGSSTNLHSVWDSKIIDNQQLSYTEYAAAINFTTPLQRITLQKQPMVEWFYQSYQMVELIYNDIKPDEKLGYLYNFKFLAIVDQQLLRGGVHLAGLLNNIFKG
jgi:hypothetical protein